MVGEITKRIIVIAFMFIAFTVEARNIRSSGSDSLNFQTAGNNTRAHIDSSGNFFFDLLTANRVPYLGASGQVFASAVTDTELGYLSGATSSLQTQIDGKLGDTLTDSLIFVGNGSNVASPVAMSGDVTISNAGVTDLSSGVDVVTASVQTPSRLDVKQDTKSNLNTYAGSASNGQLVFATDEKKMYQVVDSALVAVGGGAGDINNILTDGGFDSDATTTVDGLTCTVGTCSQEETNQFIGDGALKIALSTQAADVVKCYDNTNAQWDNQMIQAEAYVKSSLAGVEMCYWDGSAESNCITYDASDEWKKIKIIEQVIDENSICYKIKSPSGTDDIFIDASSIFSLKVDGTTKVERAFVDENIDPATMTATSGDLRFGAANITINGDQFLVYTDADGYFTATKDSTHNVCFTGRSTTANNNLTIFKNGSTDLVNRSSGTVSAQWHTVCANVDLKAGEDFNIQSGFTLTSSVTQWLSITSTHYEQKSVLSDATAESTFTDWASYTPSTSQGFGTLGATDLKWKRVGTDMLIQGTFVSGTSTNTEARLELPTGYTTRSDLPSRTVAGKGAYTGTGGVDQLVLVEPSRTYMNFGIANVGTAGLSAADGDQMVAVGQTYGFSASFPIEGWLAKPQIVGTFKPAVEASSQIGLDVAPIVNITTTYMDFPTNDFGTDFDGCGNGHKTTSGTATTCKYVVPETGKYNVNSQMYLSDTDLDVNEGMLLLTRINNVTKCQDEYRHDLSTSIVYRISMSVDCTHQLTKGDVVEIAVHHTAVSDLSFEAGSSAAHFTVNRIDQAGRLSQEEPKKIQTKILSGDVTTDNFDMPDFTYTGLTIGQHYRISGQLIGFNTGVADNFALVYHSAAAGAGTVYGECKLGSNTTLYEFCGINVVFKAVSTTLYFHTESLSPAQFNGDTSKKESFVQLEEVNMVETNQW